MIQSLLEAQYAKPHILGGNKSILIKKRNLDATATNIHNGCSVFNNLKKSLSLKSDGFIIQKSLLRVAEYIDMNTCPHFDLV